MPFLLSVNLFGLSGVVFCGIFQDQAAQMHDRRCLNFYLGKQGGKAMSFYRDDIVMAELSWSFIGEAYANYADFEQELIAAQTQSDFDATELVILAPAISVSYEVWEEDDEVEKDVIITADDGHFLSCGEIMFKLHNAVVAQLSDEDEHFFEGLKPLNLKAMPPSYQLCLGS